MSLRVLLADESASIRKVFQLGLQDYGAEVKSVHNGLDVIQVAEKYHPDIIFADILLQKKNGYEVSEEIRNHPELNDVPVVLMWSSFMELDQDKYKACKAQAEMEKPFEVELMRSHIENLVDRAKNQQLSQFLTFPESINNEFVEEDMEPTHQENEDNEIDGDESTSVFNIQAEESAFDAELESTDGGAPFMPMETQVNPSQPPRTAIEDSWETKALNDNSFTESNIKETDTDLDNFQSMELNADENLKLDDFLYKPKDDGLQAPEPPPMTITGTDNTDPIMTPAETLDLGQIEAIVRAHTQEIIKLNIQEQLPKIIEKVVREELEKALKHELALKSAGNP
jgi:CheY-like chemotaxis protein